MTKCSACGARYVKDPDDHPLLDPKPTCDCQVCPDCGRRYRIDDPAGVVVGSSDEIAAKHDPSDLGKCDACWVKVLKPKQLRG